MNGPQDDVKVDQVRRKLLKASAVIGGSLAAGTLPYEKPALKSFFGVRSAYAQATSFLEINMAGRLGTGALGSAQDTKQDCFEFEVFSANTQLTIQVTTDGNLDVEVFLYAPGAVGSGQTNLLTSNPLGLNGSGVGGSENGVVTVAATGIYTICLEDVRPGTNAQVGDYQIKITADKPIGAPTASADEQTESDRG